MTQTFGTFLKDLRIKTGQTLRNFCKKHKVAPGTWSKLERDILPPPQGEELEHYSHLVGLKPNTPEWVTFFALAVIAQARVLSAHEKEQMVVNQLPAILPPQRDPKALDELIELVQASFSK